MTPAYTVIPQRLNPRTIVWLCRTPRGVTTWRTKDEAMEFGHKFATPKLRIVREEAS